MTGKPTEHGIVSRKALGGELSRSGRYLVLVTAFLGWMLAGMQMGLNTLAMRAATIDLLLSNEEVLVAKWYAWFACVILFGAATGGLVFGWIGDRFGRSKAMGFSILCFSAFSGAAYFAQTPMQLLILRFVAGLGVGGLWPNAVALVSEVWPNVLRPILAGIIGTAATAGIVLMSAIGMGIDIQPENWRWVMLVGAAPVLLAFFVWGCVPESPRWLAGRVASPDGSMASVKSSPVSEVFRFPLLWRTVMGIVLGTVPLIGGWGSSNWLVPWADQMGAAAENPDYSLKATTLFCRAFTGMLGTLVGGWIASRMGRRRVYFLMSVTSLVSAQYLFRFVTPTDPYFLVHVGVLGFFSTMYFGWLPLFLPELFPTSCRSTGTGVTYNFGRILTAATIFATGALMTYFRGDYARIGTITSLIFAVGMVVILFAPDTTSKQLED